MTATAPRRRPRRALLPLAGQPPAAPASSASVYHSVLVALADPSRRALLEAVRERPRAVGELASVLPISRPAVSQHLRVLERARLVRCEPRGRRHVYSLEPRGLLELQLYLQTFWGDLLRSFQAAAQRIEEEGRTP